MKRFTQEYGMFLAAAVIAVVLMMLMVRMTGFQSMGARMMKQSVSEHGSYFHIECRTPVMKGGR
ncbi:MAG: hypothetical protein LKK51_07530 [Eubacterium sp.]|uniref:hypothetical protein n=1 Tax=Eubacterium sp. F2 TaxID=3381348 RepID=UPI003908283A|nr:hypothetical protein [Eubacterium sp.]